MLSDEINTINNAEDEVAVAKALANAKAKIDKIEAQLKEEEDQQTEIDTPAEIVDLPAVKISKPKAAKKKITVKWKKVSKKNLKKISKIQIQYSTSKNFSKNVKTKYASAKKTSYKIKSLKKGKRYYVRIRAYKKTNGVVHVSKWSAKRSIKAK